MTNGVGGSTAPAELAALKSMRDEAIAIDIDEYRQRLERVRASMAEAGVDALYLDATTSLRYFTGMQCYPSERLHGALVSAHGEILYICPFRGTKNACRYGDRRKLPALGGTRGSHCGGCRRRAQVNRRQ